jgi:type VI secretion system protein ImpM
MKQENPAMRLSSPPGWYGKLPGSGDFMRRRLPENVVSRWSHWFSSGMQRIGAQAEPQLQRAPVWNFVVPASLGAPWVQMGCLLPARDRVGRQYPICAMQLCAPEAWHPLRLKLAGDWYYRLGKTLSQAVHNRYSGDQLDAALLALDAPAMPSGTPRSDVLDIIGYDDAPDTLNWPKLASFFDPEQYSSFWWSNQSDGSAFYTHSHSGNFTSQLFFRLFDPLSSHQGLHTPMFGKHLQGRGDES